MFRRSGWCVKSLALNLQDSREIDAKYASGTYVNIGDTSFIEDSKALCILDLLINANMLQVLNAYH